MRQLRFGAVAASVAEASRWEGRRSVEWNVLYVLVPFVGLAIGLGLALLRPRRAALEREDLLAEARAERDERLRAARSRALEERAEAEGTARQAFSAIEEVERRLSRREERLESRLDGLASRETAADAREVSVAERAERIVSVHDEQVAELERIRSLPGDVARATLLDEVAPTVRDAAIARAERIVQEADEACRHARARPTALAVQRTSSELVGEFALVPVPIPREEIKGRIIGREGRNIKAFEAATGVELVIDDAPEVVTLSGFDPFRREVARLALLELVEDGRIHPGRIDEAVTHTRDVLGRQLREDGVGAAEAAGVGSIPAELAELLGRLRLFRGDGQDALQSSIRLANLSVTMATELKADVRVARRAGLFHDLGRAVGREAGGSTDTIVADVLTRAGESPAVVTAVRPPGELYPTVTPEQAAVWLARNTVEAGLGAREEAPIRRVEAIEKVAQLVEGVAEPFAFQLGTRVTLLLRPTESGDMVNRMLLARSVLERIEASLGPRIGLTIAVLVSLPRRRADGPQGGPQGNGAARVDGGRQGQRHRQRRSG